MAAFARSSVAAALLAATLLLAGCWTPDGTPRSFSLEEATIARVHRAMLAGELSARQLVEGYRARIRAYDAAGPALNAFITLNPRALVRADSLDHRLRTTGELTGPLHGVPVVVKDNYDTHDLPTTAGSLSLASSIPPDDAFQVRRIREAGAIVLGKTNMAEFAFSPYETVGSAHPGYTRNPYATNRVPAGSSGGTAAAVAANLGLVGLGTDTGNSIRGPSSHTGLVGVRSTMGLTSRDGIVPLYLDRDVGGPMTRTVEDAARILDVIAGPDPADPVTADAAEHRPRSYLDALDAEGLRGARIGALPQLVDSTADAAVVARFEGALDALREAGATVVEDVRIEIPDGPRWCRRFRHDLNAYLESLGPDAPVRSLEEVIASGRYHPTVEQSLRSLQAVEGTPETNEECRNAARTAETLRANVRRALAEHDLDALAYPSWDNPPRLIGDLNTPHGNNSPVLSPPTGFPAVTVPMGHVDGGLPVGLQLLGDAWSESTLLRLAYGYEQTTRHRRPPPTTPRLRR